MTTWQYRIITSIDTESGEYYENIHRVYFDETDRLIYYSRDPILPFGSDKEELLRDLIRMLEAFKKPEITFCSLWLSVNGGEPIYADGYPICPKCKTLQYNKPPQCSKCG